MTYKLAFGDVVAKLAPTATLMTEFYQNWQKTSDKAPALRQAMLTTMKNHPEPKNWAAFTLIGEAE